MDTMFCGDLIRQARKASGYTQEVLAKRAHISRTYLADVERNRYNPSMTTLQNIAQALNTSIHELLPKVPIIHLSPEKQERFTVFLPMPQMRRASLSRLQLCVQKSAPTSAIA